MLQVQAHTQVEVEASLPDSCFFINCKID